MPIESVGIGDLVLTGSDGWKPVLETMTEKRDDAIILHGQGSNGLTSSPRLKPGGFPCLAARVS